MERISKLIGKQIVPSFNSKACLLFDEINKDLNWNGQHAENGGEKEILGYFVDYYEPIKNIVIEYDESHHKSEKRKKQDLIRQKEIEQSLNCKFYRIDETNFCKNSFINILKLI